MSCRRRRRRSAMRRPLFVKLDTLALKLFSGLVASTASSAAGADLDNKGKETERGGHPHKGKHLGANVRLDVDALSGASEDIGEDDEHDCCNGGGNHRDQGSDEGEDEEGKSAQPDEGAAAVGRVAHGSLRTVIANDVFDGLRGSRGHRKRADEDHHEVEDGACEKQAEHPFGGDLGQVEGFADLGGYLDWEVGVSAGNVMFHMS